MSTEKSKRMAEKHLKWTVGAQRVFLCRDSMLKALEESTYGCLISFRSSDFGTLYTKLNLQPGIATVIDNFYICSTNKKKVCGKKPFL